MYFLHLSLCVGGGELIGRMRAPVIPGPLDLITLIILSPCQPVTSVTSITVTSQIIHIPSIPHYNSIPI